MAAYSLTQYASVLLLYEIGSNLSDIEYLYIDLFLITVFAFFFGLTKAYEGEYFDSHFENNDVSLKLKCSILSNKYLLFIFDRRTSKATTKQFFDSFSTNRFSLTTTICNNWLPNISLVLNHRPSMVRSIQHGRSNIPKCNIYKYNLGKLGQSWGILPRDWDRH